MCALFGWLDYRKQIPQKLLQKLTQALARTAEERGTDAAGISYVKNGHVTIYKRPKPAHQMHFRVPVGTTAVMGHTRFATQGDQKYNWNNHPFHGFAGKEFAFAHNGVLYNDKKLRKTNKLPKTKIETDSYVAVQLLEQAGNLDFSSLKQMAETVDGNFTFTLLDEENTLYFIKGTSPLYLVQFQELGLYVYTSTQSILENALQVCNLHHYTYTVLKISNGEILSINRSGNLKQDSFSLFSYDWLDAFYPVSTSDQEADTELDTLLKMCSCFGVEQETILELLDFGYSYDEVETFLMSPSLLQEELKNIAEI